MAPACGEIGACLIRVPVEVIKQRCQATDVTKSRDNFNAVLRTEGFSGFYTELEKYKSGKVLKISRFLSTENSIFFLQNFEKFLRICKFWIFRKNLKFLENLKFRENIKFFENLNFLENLKIWKCFLEICKFWKFRENL